MKFATIVLCVILGMANSAPQFPEPYVISSAGGPTYTVSNKQTGFSIETGGALRSSGVSGVLAHSAASQSASAYAAQQQAAAQYAAQQAAAGQAAVAQQAAAEQYAAEAAAAQRSAAAVAAQRAHQSVTVQKPALGFAAYQAAPAYGIHSVGAYASQSAAAQQAAAQRSAQAAAAQRSSYYAQNSAYAAQNAAYASQAAAAQRAAAEQSAAQRSAQAAAAQRSSFYASQQSAAQSAAAAQFAAQQAAARQASAYSAGSIVGAVAPNYRVASSGALQNAFILRQTQDSADDGSAFNYAFETDNGISAQSAGTLKIVPGEQDPVQAVQGSYSYVGDDGVTYTVNYVADENGFRADGAHIPQIPEEIARSIEYNLSHPQHPDTLIQKK